MNTDTNVCKFTQGVDCSCRNRKCENCGFNPTVAAQRIKEFLNKPKGDE